MKITIKTWLTKVASIFTHRTSLLHRISPPVSFYSKTKIGYIFRFFHSQCFAFHFRYAFEWRINLSCVIRNNWNNVRCTNEGEKSNKCCASNHILFVEEERLRYISYAVISFFIFRENSLSEGKILDDKNVYKIIHQSNFCSQHCLNCVV